MTDQTRDLAAEVEEIRRSDAQFGEAEIDIAVTRHLLRQRRTLLLHIAALSRELEELRAELARLRQQLADEQHRVRHHVAKRIEFQRQLVAVTAELAGRDEKIERLTRELEHFQNACNSAGNASLEMQKRMDAAQARARNLKMALAAADGQQTHDFVDRDEDPPAAACMPTECQGCDSPMCQTCGEDPKCLIGSAIHSMSKSVREELSLFAAEERQRRALAPPAPAATTSKLVFSTDPSILPLAPPAHPIDPRPFADIDRGQFEASCGGGNAAFGPRNSGGTPE